MPPPTRDWLRKQKTQQKEADRRTRDLGRDVPAPSRGFHETRIDAGPIFAKGPDDLRAALSDPQEVSGPGQKPSTGPLALATEPEWYIYWALTQLRKKPGVDFTYRGETSFAQGLSGQTQLDFQMLDGSDIAIEVQGTFYHYGQGSAKLVQDRVRSGELAGHWTVIDIDEDDAMRNPLYYVQEALLGHDHSYRYKNYFVKPFKTQG